MAKKTEWSKASIKDRYNIHRFWMAKNKTNAYSNKLEKLFNDASKLISEFPEIGVETDVSG